MSAYQLDENTFVGFRDAKGRFSSASRAKSFFVYVNKKLAFFGKFKRVNQPVSDKFDEIYYAYLQYITLDDIYEEPDEALEDLEEYDDDIEPDEVIIDDEVIPIEDASLSELERVKSELEKEAQLYELLLEEVRKEDPDLADELEDQYLMDQMYKELRAEFVADEIERKLEIKLPAEIFVEEKEIESDVFGIRDIEKFYYSFEKPYEWTSKDPKDIYDFYLKELSPAAKTIIETIATRGTANFIFRLTYYEVDEKGNMRPTGFGPSRFTTAYRGKPFLDLLNELLMDQFKLQWENYMRELGVVYLSGFTLENMVR